MGTVSVPEYIREKRKKWGCSMEGLQDEDQQPELHVIKGKKTHPNEGIQSWSEFLSQLLMAVPAGCTDS